MIIMFSFVAKDRLCDSGSFANNNPCYPKNFTYSFKKSTLLKFSSSQTFIRRYQRAKRM
jgi:hypothetical protein